MLSPDKNLQPLWTLSLKKSPSFFTSIILCPSSFMDLGTFWMGSPESSITSRTSPGFIISSFSLVLTKFMGQTTPRRSSVSLDSTFICPLRHPLRYAAKDRFHVLQVLVQPDPLQGVPYPLVPLAVGVVPLHRKPYGVRDLLVRQEVADLDGLHWMAAVFSAYPHGMTVPRGLPRLCRAGPYAVAAVDALHRVEYGLPGIGVALYRVLLAGLGAYGAARAFLLCPDRLPPPPGTPAPLRLRGTLWR